MSKTIDNAATPAKPKLVAFTANIPEALGDALEDHRWSAKLTRPGLVRKALEEYAENHGVVPAEAPATEA